MSINVNYNPKFSNLSDILNEIFVNFNFKGKILVNGQRNIIKLFEFEEITLSIK